ncbi:1-aminocyclopropane-1-carboxylate deaminase/D-cysteine desulfhydrase [Marinoscillum furvescens]|uniref:1-aminocyclopropane-1-carboxylate deaminase/D-cysteine desulfhydrase-like pyridoxal-dependent ACC family enzyme n=1 Tax=Marinoscillum furvescens DSM 4134 TaxID=1122208 RepID=A0A3D9L4F6_MARFU|nr:pyridoxal-phosphate dependent enzyme [Marinoscillum furvescens]REE00409.1 1-aminocyclopropane-1-carboxylate deaminase/D-cysteine desulfhydrase-like pyridoxal-dependent ACC family enzyme [Marinoscillum furvescens DSM 4134]
MAGLPSPLDHISVPLFNQKGVEVWVKREDLIHPEIMGNKWRKLKYNLQHYHHHDYSGLVTFGGAYSNHIAATAAACHEQNIPCIGIIRGEELNSNSNPTLRFAHQKGMQLEFVNRSLFRQYRDGESLPAQLANYYRVPEGGTNALALAGCKEMLTELDETFDYIACPIGTAGTFAGILSGVSPHTTLLGFSSLKGDFIHQQVRDILATYGIENQSYRIFDNYHFGGYAKTSAALISFINRTKQETGLQLEPIYTGKMFFAVWDLIAKGYFKAGSKIMLVHTGGLQGIAGFLEKHKKKILL